MCFKIAIGFALCHVILIMPHVLGFAYISMHEGLYGVIMSIIEIPGILLLNVFGLESDWILFIFTTIFYSIVGFFLGKIIVTLFHPKMG